MSILSPLARRPAPVFIFFSVQKYIVSSTNFQIYVRLTALTGPSPTGPRQWVTPSLLLSQKEREKERGLARGVPHSVCDSPHCGGESSPNERESLLRGFLGSWLMVFFWDHGVVLGSWCPHGSKLHVNGWEAPFVGHVPCLGGCGFHP